MKKILTMMLAVAASTSGAATPSDADQVTLKGAGEGAWEIWCDFVRESGATVTRIISAGRGDTYTSVGLRRAECRYKNGGKAPLVISVQGDAWLCPFKGAADGQCDRSFSKSAFGEFSLRRK